MFISLFASLVVGTISGILSGIVVALFEKKLNSQNNQDIKKHKRRQ